MTSPAASQVEFERLLQDHGFTLRQNGKNWVIDPIPREGETKKPKPHRFSTLGVHAEYEAFLDRVEPVMEETREDETARARAGEKEKEGQVEGDRDEPEQPAPEQDGPEMDNEDYVKYGGNADPKSEPVSQQNPEVSGERDPRNDALKREPEPYTEPHQDDELSDHQRAWKAESKARRRKSKDRHRGRSR